MENIKIFKDVPKTETKPVSPMEAIQETLNSPRPDFAEVAEKVGAIIENFTGKTLYQEPSKYVNNDLVLSFVEKAFNPVEEKLGKYIEKKLQYIPRRSNYNRESFLPNAGNSNVTVGTSTSIRRDVDNLGVAQQLQIAEPTDANMIQSRLDFEQTRYANILMGAGENFPMDSFSALPISIQTTYANWCLNGRTFTNQDGSQNAVPGLLTLYETAVGQTGVSVNDIDLSSTNTGVGYHHVVYTPVSSTTYDETRIEALAQLNQLIFKMRNPNKCFAFSAGLQQSANIADLVLVCTNQTYEGMKAADVSYFKNINSVFDVNNLLVLPETTFNTDYFAGGSTIFSKQDAYAAQVEKVGTISSTEKIEMAGGDIMIYEKTLFQRFSNSVLETSEEYFKNNRTITHGMNGRPSFDILTDRAYCVYSAPVLVNQYAMPVVDVKVVPEP